MRDRARRKTLPKYSKSANPRNASNQRVYHHQPSKYKSRSSYFILTARARARNLTTLNLTTLTTPELDLTASHRARAQSTTPELHLRHLPHRERVHEQGFTTGACTAAASPVYSTNDASQALNRRLRVRLRLLSVHCTARLNKRPHRH